MSAAEKTLWAVSLFMLGLVTAVGVALGMWLYSVATLGAFALDVMFGVRV